MTFMAVWNRTVKSTIYQSHATIRYCLTLNLQANYLQSLAEELINTIIFRVVYYRTFKNVTRARRQTKAQCCPGWIHIPGQEGCQRG